PPRAGTVAGGLAHPARGYFPHLRATAREGRLFRPVADDRVQAHGLSSIVLGEKTAFESAARQIKPDERTLKRTLVSLGRDVDGLWRAEEKLAALAAWVAVSENR